MSVKRTSNLIVFWQSLEAPDTLAVITRVWLDPTGLEIFVGVEAEDDRVTLSYALSQTKKSQVTDCLSLVWLEAKGDLLWVIGVETFVLDSSLLQCFGVRLSNGVLCEVIFYIVPILFVRYTEIVEPLERHTDMAT